MWPTGGRQHPAAVASQRWPVPPTLAVVATLLRYGLRMSGLLVAVFALVALYNEFFYFGYMGSGQAAYVSVVGLLLLWTAYQLFRAGSRGPETALRARRRLGWTLCLSAVAVSLVALAGAVVNIASGVPVPEVMRPIGLLLCSGAVLLTLGRWTLRHAHREADG
jgi:hypothetical protein